MKSWVAAFGLVAVVAAVIWEGREALGSSVSARPPALAASDIESSSLDDSELLPPPHGARLGDPSLTATALPDHLSSRLPSRAPVGHSPRAPPSALLRN